MVVGAYSDSAVSTRKKIGVEEGGRECKGGLIDLYFIFTQQTKGCGRPGSNFTEW